MRENRTKPKEIKLKVGRYRNEKFNTKINLSCTKIVKEIVLHDIDTQLF